MHRRRFLKTMGFGGISALGLLTGCDGFNTRKYDNPNTDAVLQPPSRGLPQASRTSDLYPAPHNPAFELDRPLTPEYTANKYNNFYEFTMSKDVYNYIHKFRTRPWEVEVKGLVKKPQTFDLDDLVRAMPLEERLYRFRCVEAWAMAVPWTGFPFKALLDRVEPESSAKYVRMLTFLRPSEASVQQADWFPWPYYEALTIEEAMNDLTLLATGIYGKEMPPQHGAPIRLVTPWKYGYKSIKSIVLIELTSEKPRTFWHDVAPSEYDFEANVNPYIPHPRWSQASERMLDTNERRDTMLYNGYAPYVAHLYSI